MIMKIKKHWKYIIVMVITIIAIFCVYNIFYNTNNIAKGKYLYSLNSENNEYTLKSYLIDGGSLSGDAIRVEIVNNLNKKAINLYYNYPQSIVDMKWIDNETVEISGIKLNIYKDTYDWRKKL